MADAQSESRDHHWADNLIYMEAGGDIVNLPEPARAEEGKERVVWGLLIALLITLPAFWMSSLPIRPFTLQGGRHPIDAVMIAIVLGMAVSNLWTLPTIFRPGIKFAIKKILPLGIILLGARLHFLDILRVGFAGLMLSLVEIVVALGLLFLFARIFRLPPKLAALLGIGTAICGGTAIVAAAPVIEAEDEDVVFSIATVTLLGLMAMFLLPVIGALAGLSPKAFGVWAGLAIHQTPQVIAAGFAHSQEAGETATIVKLARVCLLAPVVFLMGLAYARSKARGAHKVGLNPISYLRLFPIFVLGFLAMALLRTVGLLPDMTIHLSGESLVGRMLSTPDQSFNVASLARVSSKFCVVVSMAGVGLETNFSGLRKIGPKPFAAGLAAALIIGGLILALIMVLEIG